MLAWMTRMVPAMLLATALPALAEPNARGASEAASVPAMTCCKSGQSQARKASGTAALQKEVGTLQQAVDSLSGQLANIPQYAPDPDNHPLWP